MHGAIRRLARWRAHLTGDVDDNCDKFRWDRDFFVSGSDLTRCIHNWGAENGFVALAGLGHIASVVISKRNPTTQRPTEFSLADASGRTSTIRAEEFRIALKDDPEGRAAKPYSSDFEIRPQADGFLMYHGQGFGHGIGLSQWGAEKLATQGYSSSRILSYFYPGARLKNLW